MTRGVEGNFRTRRGGGGRDKLNNDTLVPTKLLRRTGVARFNANKTTSTNASESSQVSSLRTSHSLLHPPSSKRKSEKAGRVSGDTPPREGRDEARKRNNEIPPTFDDGSIGFNSGSRKST